MPDRTYTEWFRFRSSALPGDSFHVIRFSGTEGLNRLFSFTVELASRNADIDTGAMLTAPAESTILRESGEDAVFRGYPARVDQGGHFGDFTFYTVKLRPAFWKLTQIRQSAIFLNKTVQETASELLNSQRFFQFHHEFRLTRDYPAPEFAMQYEESFFDYILFRMEDQGAYFFFAPDGDRVIFADAPRSHDKAGTTLSYAPASGLDAHRREEVLQVFSLAQMPLPRKVVLRCDDWKEPNRVIVGEAEVSAQGLGDVYLAGESSESEAEARRLARIRAEELICRSRLFTGAGSVPVLRPGLVFTLTDHYSKSFNRNYLVTEITHQGAQEAYITLGLGIPMQHGTQDAADRYFYRNNFTCIPADVPYRPERTAPRTKISGVLRAFVDGAANRRAEMDEFGRYKLLFPFDLSGRKGGNASCWVRMAGPQSGKDSGLAFPLLPGTEVVVSFIDGNPDRPVITGSLANGETGSISGRGNANISGIRSVGGNQLTINDTDKSQGIALTTAAGLGYSMSSGSLSLTSETADTVLKAASVGGSEVSGAFKDVVSGFKLSHSATDDTIKIVAALAPALANNAAAVLDALSGKVGKVEEEVKWSSTALKSLAPVIDAAFSIYDEASSAGKTYGVCLKAEEHESESALMVKPSTSKLVTMIVGWIGGRLVAYGADTLKGGKDIYKNTEEQARKEYDDSMKAAVEALHKDEEYKDKSYKYENDKGDKQKYANVSHDLDELIEKKKLEGKDVKNLEKVKKELDEGWSKYHDEDSDDYYKKAKQQAIRDIVTSSTTELLPEIVSLITLIIGRVKMAKTLGGIALTSPDNNINLGAQKTVSVHTETGILLDTGTTFDDAGKWGVSETDYKAKAAAGGMDSWNVTGGAVSTFFPANAAPTKKFVATDTELFSVHADYHLAATTNEWISQAKTHTLRTDSDTSPKAQVKMTEADKTIEAKVAADGKIVLTRGNAKPKLELSDAGGILANGTNVQLTLTEKEARLSALGESGVISLAAGKQATLQGGNAGVTCKNGEIVIDPTAAGKSVVSGITLKRTEISASGVMELKGGMIKIG